MAVSIHICTPACSATAAAALPRPPICLVAVHDLYWSEPFDLSASLAACRANWGVQPRRRDWATIEWGGRQITSSSNIVFSNGLMDPWHGTGVLEDLSDTLVAVIIPEVRREHGRDFGGKTASAVADDSC